MSYNGDYIRSKRSGASIGIGNKSDFTKDLTCSPGSNRYDIKSKLDQALSADKGYSVGKGRKVLNIIFSKWYFIATSIDNDYEPHL